MAKKLPVENAPETSVQATPETGSENTPTGDSVAPDAPNPAPTPESSSDAKPEAPANDSAKLQKRLRRIERANRNVMELNAEVAECDSEVKAAKGRLATAQEERDAAVIELSRIIDDAKAGQDLLPGMEDETGEPENPELTNPNTSPISDLGTKQLTSLLGADLMEASKNREEPLGLTNAQLDKFESAGIATIHDLEEVMKKKPHDWWSFLAKKADAAIVNRVLNSWREYRMKCPVSQEREPEREQTIDESLAEKNLLKTPAEWAAEYGTVIVDPDGWRGNNPLDQQQPISRNEFAKRWSESTVEGFPEALVDLVESLEEPAPVPGIAVNTGSIDPLPKLPA